MGYSLEIRCKDETSKIKMKEFMEKNFKPFQELIKDQECFKSFPGFNHTGKHAPSDDDIGDGKNTLALGFHISGSLETDMYYVWRILTWMALKVGKTSNYKNQALPTIWDDEGQKYPIHLNENDFAATGNTGKKYIVDETGWTSFDSTGYAIGLEPRDNESEGMKKWRLEKRLQFELISLLTKEELNRINTLWLQEN